MWWNLYLSNGVTEILLVFFVFSAFLIELMWYFEFCGRWFSGIRAFLTEVNEITFNINRSVHR